MVLLNSTTVMVAGGVQGSAVLANTYMISDDNKVTFDKLLIINDN
jgi:NaMN:DMB phosphoribosyltransferase